VLRTVALVKLKVLRKVVAATCCGDGVAQNVTAMDAKFLSKRKVPIKGHTSV